MRILISGGEKSVNIVNGIKSKFTASGDEFIVIPYIEDIPTLYAKGDTFDKALITMESVTRDNAIKSEAQLRQRINSFALDASKRVKKSLYVFLSPIEEMANIMQEETLMIERYAAVLIKAKPYSVQFFVDILVKDVAQIPDNLIYKPTLIGVEQKFESDADIEDIEDEPQVIVRDNDGFEDDFDSFDSDEDNPDDFGDDIEDIDEEFGLDTQQQDFNNEFNDDTGFEQGFNGEFSESNEFNSGFEHGTFEQNTDAQHSDEQYSNEQYTDGQYTDEQYNDEQYIDEQYSNEQYTGEQYENQYGTDEYADEQYANEYNANEYNTNEYNTNESLDNQQQYNDDFSNNGYDGFADDTEQLDDIDDDFGYEQSSNSNNEEYAENNNGYSDELNEIPVYDGEEQSYETENLDENQSYSKQYENTQDYNSEYNTENYNESDEMSDGFDNVNEPYDGLKDSSDIEQDNTYGNFDDTYSQNYHSNIEDLQTESDELSQNDNSYESSESFDSDNNFDNESNFYNEDNTTEFPEDSFAEEPNNSKIENFDDTDSQYEDTSTLSNLSNTAANVVGAGVRLAKGGVTLKKAADTADSAVIGTAATAGVIAGSKLVNTVANILEKSSDVISDTLNSEGDSEMRISNNRGGSSKKINNQPQAQPEQYDNYIPGFDDDFGYDGTEYGNSNDTQVEQEQSTFNDYAQPTGYDDYKNDEFGQDAYEQANMYQQSGVANPGLTGEELSEFSNEVYDENAQQQINAGQQPQVEQPQPQKKGLFGGMFGRGKKNAAAAAAGAGMAAGMAAGQNAGGLGTGLGNGYSQVDNGQGIGNTGTPSQILDSKGRPVNVNKVRDKLRPFAARGTAIAVTGFGGSGTSTVAYGLANILCQLGYSILLVDFDVNGRTQSYITRSCYDAVDPESANIMAAVNSTTGIDRQLSIVKEGFHLLTMGLGADVRPIEEMIKKEKLNRFFNTVKNKHQFVIYDLPFDYATGYCSEITYNCDNIVMVTDSSTWGLGKMMLDVCNISSEDMQDTMFNRGQVVFNKFRNMKKLFGHPFRSAYEMLSILDRQVVELVGDVGLHFSTMKVSGIIHDDPSIEDTYFTENNYSDTRKGQNIFLELVQNIVLNK